MPNRKYGFLVSASAKVYVEASDEAAAGELIDGIALEEFSIDFTTGDGHLITQLEIERSSQELDTIDGNELGELCSNPLCRAVLKADEVDECDACWAQPGPRPPC